MGRHRGGAGDPHPSSATLPEEELEQPLRIGEILTGSRLPVRKQGSLVSRDRSAGSPQPEPERDGATGCRHRILEGTIGEYRRAETRVEWWRFLRRDQVRARRSSHGLLRHTKSMAGRDCLPRYATASVFKRGRRPDEAMVRSDRMSLRIGLVGAGNMARTHARHGRRSGDRVTHVLGAGSERAPGLAAGLGAEVVADLNELLDAVDVVDICSPTDTHVDYVEQAAARGVPIVCEKPLGRTSAEAARAVRPVLPPESHCSSHMCCASFLNTQEPGSGWSQEIWVRLPRCVSTVRHTCRWETAPGSAIRHAPVVSSST